MQFTEFGIEGVVPLELLPPEVRSKYQAKPNEKSKRAKKDETKGSVPPSEDNQVNLVNSENMTGMAQCNLLALEFSVVHGILRIMFCVKIVFNSFHLDN